MGSIFIDPRLRTYPVSMRAITYMSFIVQIHLDGSSLWVEYPFIENKILHIFMRVKRTLCKEEKKKRGSIRTTNNSTKQTCASCMLCIQGGENCRAPSSSVGSDLKLHFGDIISLLIWHTSDHARTPHYLSNALNARCLYLLLYDVPAKWRCQSELLIVNNMQDTTLSTELVI